MYLIEIFEHKPELIYDLLAHRETLLELLGHSLDLLENDKLAYLCLIDKMC